MTDCLAMSSMVLIQTGLEVKEGLRHVERAVEPARRAQDPAGLTFALVNLAVALMLCERFDAVQSVYEERRETGCTRRSPAMSSLASSATRPTYSTTSPCSTCATARSKEARDSRGPPPRSAPSSVVSRFRAQPNSYKPLARRASPPAQQTAGMQYGRKGKNWRPRTQSPTRAGAAGRVPVPKPDGTASHRPRSHSLSSPPRE